MDLGEFAEAGAVLDEAIDAAALIGDARLLADAKLVRLLVQRHLADPERWSEEVHAGGRARTTRVRSSRAGTASSRACGGSLATST